MQTKPTLLVIIASTRPVRVGAAVATWFASHASSDDRFAVEIADLAALDLPMLDEPKHPRLRDYHYEHTRTWSATVDAADAVAIVMPEYNHSFTAPLKNAIDYLFHEWARKPVGLISYGGISAGTRAAAAIRIPLTALDAHVVQTAINIPMIGEHVHDGVFEPPEPTVAAADALLGSLLDAVKR